MPMAGPTLLDWFMLLRKRAIAAGRPLRCLALPAEARAALLIEAASRWLASPIPAGEGLISLMGVQILTDSEGEREVRAKLQ